MAEEKKIEQITPSSEQVKPIDKAVESSLDSAKIEQAPQAQVQEKSDTDQIASQVVIPDDTAQVVAPLASEIIHKEVDNILSADMDKVFLSLDAGTQREFKLKGEETAKKITDLLLEAKIKVGEITKIILEWLRIIPQANKHYLEQEAKIKTDKILKINKEK